VARALALRRGSEVVLDVHETPRARRILSHFPLAARFEPPGWLPQRWYRPSPTFEERGYGYDEAVLALPDGTWLAGHFQSYRYFEDVWPTLRPELTPCVDRIRGRDASLEEAIEEANDGAPDLAGAIAVHVRRGDYQRFPLFQVCTPGYYREAIACLRGELPDARFFVFSDDLAWCEATLADTGATFVRSEAHPRPVYDLWLMTRCRHHIVSNSTFSWWGAVLAGVPAQRVIAPARWFTDEEMSQRAMRETVPASWQRWQVE
jgi:hypothetical protein